MVEVLGDHLFVNGIDKGYTRWIWHGESAREDTSINSDNRKCDEIRKLDCNESDKLEHMVHDVEKNFMDHPKILKRLKKDAETPLYVGCSQFTRLSTILRLHNLKAKNRWSGISFMVLLQLLKDIFPEDNELSNHAYEDKRIMCSMSMDYEKIYACPNDCIFYRKECEGLKICPICDLS